VENSWIYSGATPNKYFHVCYKAHAKYGCRGNHRQKPLRAHHRRAWAHLTEGVEAQLETSQLHGTLNKVVDFGAHLGQFFKWSVLDASLRHVVQCTPTPI